jgi:RNA polymerase sigma factor (sigma-70 family)
MTIEVARAGLWSDAERRRLVHLCAAVTGDRGAAEDLAQETLLEAWRNAHKLHDATGADRWLSAIARNVCLRWARGRGRDLAVRAAVAAEAPAAPLALEAEHEQEHEALVAVLDGALARLPPDTRAALVHRHVDELSHAEIAARLGVSADAVSMRLTRGKTALRRLLAEESDEPDAAGWRETRVWCSGCGRSRLEIRSTAEPATIAFRCPGCSPAMGVTSELPLANPMFAELVGGLVRPAAIVGRVADWTRRYFAVGAGGTAACTRCAGAVVLRPYARSAAGGLGHCVGLAAECGRCGEVVSTSAAGIALATPELRRLRREHPRLRLVATTELDAGGRDSLLLRYDDVRSSVRAEVVLARDTFCVAAVHA